MMVEIMLMMVEIIKKIAINLLSLVPFGKWCNKKGVNVSLESHWPKAYFCRSSVNFKNKGFFKNFDSINYYKLLKISQPKQISEGLHKYFKKPSCGSISLAAHEDTLKLVK